MYPCDKCLFQSFGRLTTVSFCSCHMTEANRDPHSGIPKVVDGCCCGYVSRIVTVPRGRAALDAEKA